MVKTKATAISAPNNLSEVIRQVMIALRNPNAKAKEVRIKALEMYPNWKDRINEQANWSSYVTQNRDKVAEELGMTRNVQTGGGGTRTQVSDFAEAKEFAETFCEGDVALALEIVEWVASKQAGKLITSLKKWQELVATAGSAEAAEKILEVLG